MKKNILITIFSIIIILLITVIIIMQLKNSTKEVSSNVQNNNIDIGELLNVVEEVLEENQDVNPKEIIRISSIKTSTPNSVGGVDLEINWTNMNEKTIKYITFTTYPVNAVGDIVNCEIRPYYQGEFKGKETGPINKGEGSKTEYVYSNAWYNKTIVKAIIMQVDIEYMDGSTVSLSGSKIDEVIY